MNPSLTIPTTPLEDPAMDYAFLRQEGIRILERLGGQLWTDFNAHDPGITILEQVCYAITDLAYRINYDIKDLLASGADDPYRSLHSPAEVLTTNPVTLTDLRKLVIDVPGVKNAWFEPVEQAEPGLTYNAAEDNLYLKTSAPPMPDQEPVSLKGIYRVLLEADSSQSFYASDILPKVNLRLQACRNLSEDFVSPSILPGEGIIVDAVIEVSAIDDPEQLLAEIYHAIASFISPRIHFYTLEEMLAQGKRIDEIMDGPALEHGFIDNTELERMERKVGLRTSDLIQEIMNVEGAVSVSSIQLSVSSNLPPAQIQKEDWYLKLDPLRTPFLDINHSLFNSAGPTIRLVRGGIAVQPKPARVDEILKRLQMAGIPEPLAKAKRDIRLPDAQDRKIGQYYSIQHQFPATYGIGGMGLPESAAPQRKAQAKQLKAYLMFFDQLLANYFAQLGNAQELFSFYAQEPRTYFSQIIADATLGLDEIRDADTLAHAAKIQAITEDPNYDANAVSTGDPASAGRKNRFLNHLLARFAEQFTDYSLLLYARLSEQDLIEDKGAFLQDYHEIGASRGTGFNYASPSWGTENVSGLEKRISRKLGLSGYQMRDLATAGANDEGGFHMLEHILIRPSQADREQWAQAAVGSNWQAAAFIAQPESRDPYSHQLSFIFPKWVKRFTTQGFADLIEKTVREETPAHIRIHLHWLTKAEMGAFEMAHKDWLKGLIAGRLWEPVNIKPDDDINHLIHIKLRDARDRMVQVLGLGIPYPLRDLKLVYPPIVTFNKPAAIQIVGAQGGVLYRLCDEDGNPISKDDTNQSFYDVQPEMEEEETEENKVFLSTPDIKKDITFTVMAIREGTDGTIVETYLNQAVSIQTGTDTGLPVAFVPSTGQVATNNQIVTSYGDIVKVVVSRTQEGISYRLVTGPEGTVISNTQIGNQSDITLTTKQGFNEDTQVNILAFRTASSKNSAILETVLTIQVRPNPAVVINVEPGILDYKTSARLTLVEPQSSAGYRLYKRELGAPEYVSDEQGNLVIQTDEGRRVLIKAPEQITNWDAPAGFTSVGVFKTKDGSVSISTGNLLEDTLFIVQATKTENREQLQLSQTVAILVRPNPAPAVGVQNDVVDTGTTGTVSVTGTQKGVFYQLRLDEKNRPVNPPGYHLTDRAIETIRLEVDLVVEDQGKAILLLPTGVIMQATTFNVLASKILTGVSAQLTGKATLGIPPQSPKETPAS